jgi:hypothetical protein
MWSVSIRPLDSEVLPQDTHQRAVAESLIFFPVEQECDMDHGPEDPITG